VDELEELHRELHVDEASASELGIVAGEGFVGNLALHALAHGEQLARGLLGVELAEQARLEHLARGALEQRPIPGDRAGAQERLPLPQPRLARVVGGQRVEGDDQRPALPLGRSRVSIR